MTQKKRYRINEIFYSLQGEGALRGTPAVFVRFSGCNLNCGFCDTNHSAYQLMSIEEIITTAIEEHNRFSPLSKKAKNLLVLTGGEPALQIDDDLINALHEAQFYIAIETNGTLDLPKGIDWTTCSPKEGSRLSISQADEVKIVYTGQPVEHYYKEISATHYILQPCSMQNTDEVIRYVKSHPHWRLSIQMHKYIGIE